MPGVSCSLNGFLWPCCWSLLLPCARSQHYIALHCIASGKLLQGVGTGVVRSPCVLVLSHRCWMSCRIWLGADQGYVGSGGGTLLLWAEPVTQLLSPICNQQKPLRKIFQPPLAAFQAAPEDPIWAPSPSDSHLGRN